MVNWIFRHCLDAEKADLEMATFVIHFCSDSSAERDEKLCFLIKYIHFFSRVESTLNNSEH